jgi:hypothetical protein
MDDRGSIPSRSSDGRIFLFTTASRQAPGPTQPPLQWVHGVKQPGPVVHHSTPSSAEVKNAWSHTSTPQYVFIMWYFIKQEIRLNSAVLSYAQDNFIKTTDRFSKVYRPLNFFEL